MPRRKKGNPVSGWVIIDKPIGKTSAQVVNDVRRALNAQKAGHAGTLDPLASGVLPIALGEATKTISFAMDSLKNYQFDISWGEERDTLDSEGRIVAESNLRPTEEQIITALPSFLGYIDQIPPIFSAIKVNGRRSYDLARNQENFKLESRKVFVESFSLINKKDDDSATFRVTSGKGTYIRALARDLAAKLGTCGHISSLRRLKVGSFSENDAISLDYLSALAHSPANFDKLLPVEVALDGIPAMPLSGEQADRMRNGQGVPLEKDADWCCSLDLEDGGIIYTTSAGSPVAIARLQQGFICPIRVLNF